jgi:hypothetical protein
MVTVLECRLTKSRVLLCVFCVQKDSVQRIFIKKCFLITVGRICRVKRFRTGGKRFADDEEVKMEARKCLRQQSKDFYAAGFDALGKRWDKCTNVSGGYVEKYMFFPGSNTIGFTFYIHLWPICWLFLVNTLIIITGLFWNGREKDNFSEMFQNVFPSEWDTKCSPIGETLASGSLLKPGIRVLLFRHAVTEILFL